MFPLEFDPLPHVPTVWAVSLTVLLLPEVLPLLTVASLWLFAEVDSEAYCVLLRLQSREPPETMSCWFSFHAPLVP